jgi:SAM-dependent methyltransferase
MIDSDGENLRFVGTAESVDSINAQFYTRFPYPWAPKTFSYLSDELFETRMLNQDIGDYTHQTIPSAPSIWVAGCGTNQAVYTALRFPHAAVRGSDFSTSSLELCGKTARNLGIRNLDLVCESLNEVSYQNRFDYIICTGVIHHNATPNAVLGKLAAALKSSGVLELMVYNRYHRTNTTAFQKALSILKGVSADEDFRSGLNTTRQIIDSIPESSPLASWLRHYKEMPEAALADALMQPVEYSYTVQSLCDLARSCGLELTQPCISQFDRADGGNSWNLRFKEPELQTRYDSLADAERWQVTNLLMLDKSPMLWFYLRHCDAGPRITESAACGAFLSATFTRNHAMRHVYVRGADGGYKLSPRPVPHPPPAEDKDVANVVAMADGKTRIGNVFASLGIATDFHTINRIRLRCTTSSFPYLRALR